MQDGKSSTYNRFVAKFLTRRVNLVITNNPKGGLFRGVAVSTSCVIICRKPATQAQARQNHRKILAFRAQSVFAAPERARLELEP